MDDGYVDDAIEKRGDHTPTGKLRGGKYSVYEAGTRVPFVTYGKGTIIEQTLAYGIHGPKRLITLIVNHD